MKDKLEKTNHKKLYYMVRKISLSFFVFLAASGIIALPISLSYQAKVQAKANELVETSQTEEDETESAPILSYFED